MKIAPRDQNLFLKNPPPHIFGAVIYGPNAPQISQYAQILAKTVVADLSDPFNSVTIEAGELSQNPTRIADELLSQSLMGGRRLIRLQSASDKITNPLKTAFEGLENCDNFIVIQAGPLTPRSSLRKYAETAKNLAIIPCYEDDERSLSQYIQHQMQQFNLQADRDVAPFLAHQLSGNRALVDRMIEKIINYKGSDTRVTLDDARACAHDVSQSSIDSAIQAALDGQYAQLDEALQILWGEGVSPVALARIGQNQLYRLRQVQTAMAQNTPLEQALKTLRPPLFFKAKPDFTRRLRQWPLPKIDRAIQALLRLEVQCKKTGIPDLALTHRVLSSLSR